MIQNSEAIMRISSGDWVMIVNQPCKGWVGKVTWAVYEPYEASDQSMARVIGWEVFFQRKRPARNRLTGEVSMVSTMRFILDDLVVIASPKIDTKEIGVYKPFIRYKK